MSRRPAPRFAPALLLAALAATPAAADSARLSAAWDAAIGEVEGVIAAEDLAEINLIGYHAAVAKLCEGFALDVDEVAAAGNALVADGPAEATPEDLMARQAEILVAVGTAHGLFLAEGALDSERFCAEAVEARGDADFDSYWQ